MHLLGSHQATVWEPLGSAMQTIVELTASQCAPLEHASYGHVLTPVGYAWLVWDSVGIRELSFVGDESHESHQMASVAVPPALGANGKRHDDEAAALLAQAFSQTSVLPVPLVLSGTTFQCEVWRALLQVGFGQTLSYAELADQTGKAGAARAVGQAVGANRLGFLVPCHRVVRKDGVIGQFRWGSAVKQRLLDWEAYFIHG